MNVTNYKFMNLLRGFFCKEKTILIGLTTYFIAQGAVRMVLSDSLDLDEAEQIYFQYLPLSLGYETKPPLYTWVLSLIAPICGSTLLSLVILKTTLLLITYLAVYFAARRIVDIKTATAATMGLALIPQILWESQRDLTHSVMVTALSGITFYLVTRSLTNVPEKHGPKSSFKATILLAFVIVLGLHAKYNYALFLTSLVIACLFFPRIENVFSGLRFAFLLATVVVLMIPHAWWLSSNYLEIQAAIYSKMTIVRPVDFIGDPSTYMVGIFDGLILPIIEFLGLWLLIFVSTTYFIGKNFSAGTAANTPSEIWLVIFRRLLARYFLVGLATLLLMVSVGGATQFKDRWFQPFLFLFPLFSLLFLRNAHFRQAVSSKLTWIGALLLLMCLVLLPVSTILAWGDHNRRSRLVIPYNEFAMKLFKDYDGKLNIVTTRKHVAGNLLFQAMKQEKTITVSLDDGGVPPITPHVSVEFLGAVSDTSGLLNDDSGKIYSFRGKYNAKDTWYVWRVTSNRDRN